MSVEGDAHWNYVELPDGTRRKMSREEIDNHGILPKGSTSFQLISLYPAGINSTGLFPFEFQGKVYRPPATNSWFTNPAGMDRLAQANRIEPYTDGETLRCESPGSVPPARHATAAAGHADLRLIHPALALDVEARSHIERFAKRAGEFVPAIGLAQELSRGRRRGGSSIAAGHWET